MKFKLKHDFLLHLTYQVILKYKFENHYILINELYSKIKYEINNFPLLKKNTHKKENHLKKILKNPSKYQNFLLANNFFFKKNNKFILKQNIQISLTKDIDKFFRRLHRIETIFFLKHKYHILLQLQLDILNFQKELINIPRNNILNTYSSISTTYILLKRNSNSIRINKIALKLINNEFDLKNFNFYTTLGGLFLSLGNYKKSLKFYKKNLKIIKCHVNKIKDYELIHYYTTLGYLYIKIYDFQNAIVYYKNALKLTEKSIQIDEMNVYTYIEVGVTLGNCYNLIKKYDYALKIFFRLIKLKISDKRFNIHINFSIADTYKYQYKYQKSLEFYKKGYLLYNKELGYSTENETDYLTYKADIYKRMEKNKRSLYYYKKALNLEKKHLAKNSKKCFFYKNISQLYFQMLLNKQGLIYYKKSINCYKNKLNLQEQQIEDEASNIHTLLDIMSTYTELGHAYYNINEIFKSYNFIKKSLNIGHTVYNKLLVDINKDSLINLLNLIHTNRVFLFKVAYKYLKTLVMNQNLNKIKDTVYSLYLQTLADFQDTEAFLSILLNQTDNEFLKKQIKLIKLKKYLLAQLLQEQKEESKQKIEDLKNEISEIEIYLYNHVIVFKESQNLKNFNSVTISQYLTSTNIFIDFAFGEDNLYIFVIHPDEAINFIEVSKEDTNLIKENIRNFRTNITTTISQMTRDSIKTKKEEVNKTLKLLYDTLIKKYLNEHIDKYKKLIISQDGLLNQLPFEALYDGEEYFLHKKDITYIASGKEFIRLHRFRDLSNEDLSIDIFADPDYDLKVNTKEDDEDDIGLSSFRTTRALDAFSLCKPLPNTKKEAEAIQKTTQLANLFIEREADEHNLKSLSNAKILHIATHGMVVENEDEQEPLLKCALALTGYNTSIKEKKDYGVFTGLKIASLDLRNTDLVVLSTCESAKGQSDTTEGVASLSRAFMMAGANATIASLWEAHDAMTQQFFTSYYSKLKTQTNYAKVFKETQLEMLTKCKEQEIEHPLFWACFCFFGT
jgi:CHAT domain-containing protein